MGAVSVVIFGMIIFVITVVSVIAFIIFKHLSNKQTNQNVEDDKEEFDEVVEVEVESATTECPACQGIVSKKAVKCPHCGEELRMHPFISEVILPVAWVVVSGIITLIIFDALGLIDGIL